MRTKYLINVCHLASLGNAAGQVGAAVDLRTHRGLVGSDHRAGGAALPLARPIRLSHSVSCSIVPVMGSSTNVWILGGYQSDFSRNLTREGLDFADLTREVVDYTLAAAGVGRRRDRRRARRQRVR